MKPFICPRVEALALVSIGEWIQYKDIRGVVNAKHFEPRRYVLAEYLNNGISQYASTPTVFFVVILASNSSTIFATVEYLESTRCHAKAEYSLLASACL